MPAGSRHSAASRSSTFAQNGKLMQIRTIVWANERARTLHITSRQIPFHRQFHTYLNYGVHGSSSCSHCRSSLSFVAFLQLSFISFHFVGFDFCFFVDFALSFAMRESQLDTMYGLRIVIAGACVCARALDCMPATFLPITLESKWTIASRLVNYLALFISWSLIFPRQRFVFFFFSVEFNGFLISRIQFHHFRNWSKN